MKELTDQITGEQRASRVSGEPIYQNQILLNGVGQV